MSGPEVRVVVTGCAQAAALSRLLGQHAVNARPALTDAVDRIQDETNRLWAANRRPLSPATIETKRRRGQPATPGVATGATRRATHPVKATASASSLRISIAPPQASMQYPTRPVMPSTTRIVGLVTDSIYDHLDVERVRVRLT